MEANILGIRISIFLGCVFWRDSEFCPQEKFKIKIQKSLSRAKYTIFLLLWLRKVLRCTLGIRLGHFR